MPTQLRPVTEIRSVDIVGRSRHTFVTESGLHHAVNPIAHDPAIGRQNTSLSSQIASSA